MKKYNIPFSPPDISDGEINEVIDTLKSGWITTGPKTKELERRLSEFTNTPKTVCLNSATAALELTLRVLGIGEGDEVIEKFKGSGRSIDEIYVEEILPDKMRYNLKYIEEFSVINDIKIMIRTAIAVVK